MQKGPAQNSPTATEERPIEAPVFGRPRSAATPATRGGAGLNSGFTLCLCGFLLAAYLSIWCFYPWRPLAEMDVPGWIVDFADQVDLMITRRDPPIVILGSSLTLAAPRRLARPTVYQEELSKRLGRPLTACCMAVPGAIASDQDFILSELLAHKKKPRLVIYTFAPRDFMDNTIEGKITSTPTRRVLTFINRRSSFLPADLSQGAISQCFDNHAAFLDLVRRHVLKSVRSYAAQLSGRPESLWLASKQAAAAAAQKPGQAVATTGGELSQGEAGAIAARDEAQAPPLQGKPADEAAPVKALALQKDLELYNRRYNPFNSARVSEQYQHLENLLKLGRANGIKVELVGMPISPANMALIKPGVYQALDQRLQAIATAYGADFYDLNGNPQVKFEQDEYLDSVHLSTSGARHFVPLFTETVVNSPGFKQAFPAKVPPS